ncbi:MAG: hypothetical protein JWQ38_2921 [Flavipsychrobacter sp.]|nr:hypothetical protein [Flavipsychrobacter sp.]
MSEITSAGNFLGNLLTAIVWILLGAAGGFFIGYLMYGQILGVNIPINAFFSLDSDIANYILQPIKEKVYISTGIGTVAGILIYLIMPSDNDSSNKNNPSISTSDELLKLYELKEKGAINEQEYETQKKRLLK